MSGFLGWIGDLFGGASAAGDVAGAASAASTAADAGSALGDSWNLSNVVPASALGAGNDSWDLFGYGAAGTPVDTSTWGQIAGGAGKLSDALKKLGGDSKTGQGQQPNFLSAGSPQQGRGNPEALQPLVNMLQQRQGALLQAQQQGQPPPQNRTIGLLGF